MEEIKAKIKRVYEDKIRQAKRDAILSAGYLGILASFAFTALALKMLVDAMILLMVSFLSLGFLISKVIEIADLKAELKEMLKEENYE